MSAFQDGLGEVREILKTQRKGASVVVPRRVLQSIQHNAPKGDTVVLVERDHQDSGPRKRGHGRIKEERPTCHSKPMFFRKRRLAKGYQYRWVCQVCLRVMKPVEVVIDA